MSATRRGFFITIATLGTASEAISRMPKDSSPLGMALASGRFQSAELEDSCPWYEEELKPAEPYVQVFPPSGRRFEIDPETGEVTLEEIET